MRLSEIAMFTEDVPATTAMYEQLFGAPIVADDGIAIFDVDGVEVLVHESYEKEADDELPGEDHFAFAVDDLDDAFANAVDNGLNVYAEPTTYEWGRSAYLVDPDGRFVELTEA